MMILTLRQTGRSEVDQWALRKPGCSPSFLDGVARCQPPPRASDQWAVNREVIVKLQWTKWMVALQNLMPLTSKQRASRSRAVNQAFKC